MKPGTCRSWPHVRNQEKRLPGTVSLLLVRKCDLLVSISLLLIRKSNLVASISLLLVSKSDFLVADELASFSDDPSTLRRTPAWPSARVRRPVSLQKQQLF